MLEPDLLKIADKTRKGFKRITSSKRPEVTKVLLLQPVMEEERTKQADPTVQVSNQVVVKLQFTY